MANYKTIKGAKQYYLVLANHFYMDSAAKEELNNCKSIEEIEHVWKRLINNI